MNRCISLDRINLFAELDNISIHSKRSYYFILFLHPFAFIRTKLFLGLLYIVCNPLWICSDKTLEDNVMCPSVQVIDKLEERQSWVKEVYCLVSG